MKITFNRWLIVLMALVLVADAAIWLNVPVLRQVLGFLYFTIVPGLLIVYAIKLNEIGFVKKFLLSVGLSISFLIFFGLLINALLPWLGYSTPLSTPSLVISFTVAIAILCSIAYWRNRNDTQPAFVLRVGQDIGNKSLWLLLFPILFPLMSVAGRYFADINGNNTLLMVMLLLIPLYVLLLIWQRKKVPIATYPLALGMIAVALLLAKGLISDYLIGGDIYSEYHAFQVVLQNQHWSLAASRGTATASLSISLLPALLQSLLGIDPVYMYKVVFLLLFALIPIIGYVIYQKYLGQLYGFLASFFLMAQIPFVNLLPAVMRVGISMITFSLALMVLLDDHMPEFRKRILFLIFLFSMVVQYYVLPVIFLVLMFVMWVVPRIWKGSFDSSTISVISAVVLPAVIIFFWWGQLTATAFSAYVVYADKVVTNLASLFIAELRSQVIIGLFSQYAHWGLAEQVTAIVQRISFVLIGIGVASTLIWKQQRVKFSNYAILMAGCLAILVAEIILPWLSFGYGPSRMYMQLLVILAPAFIIGCQATSSIINAVWSYVARLVGFIVRNNRFRYLQPRINLLAIFIGVILISQFITSLGLHNYFLDSPGCTILDVERFPENPRYIYNSEVSAAEWLAARNQENFPIWMDNILQPGSGQIFEYTDYGVGREFKVSWLNKEERPGYGTYVFLGHSGVVKGEVSTIHFEYDLLVEEREPLTECAHLFADMNKIYANSTTEIYR